MNKGRAMQDRIKEYNESQVEERKNLPNLFEAIKLAQSGNKEVIDKFFYGVMVIEKFPYEGKMKSYEVKKVKFWDKPTDIFISNLKKQYTKSVAIGENNSYSGRNINYKFNVSNFEESEIDELFYSYMMELVGKIKLENFIKDTESITLNAIRKYIRVDFENNFLKRVHNERIGLERVQVDGKMYWVKNKEEEVFFDDINCGQDENGERVHFLDVVGNGDYYTGIDLSDLMPTSKKFIEDNLEEALTNNQYEKWLLLVEHVNTHGVESILDKYTGKLKKTAIAKIFYPNTSERSTTVINKLINRMNDRIEKLLVDNNVDFISNEEEKIKELAKISKTSEVVEVYTGGWTEEEVEKYFSRHVEGILRAYRDGRLTFDKGTNSMLPSLPSMLELPFDVYEEWVNGGFKTKEKIVREYYNPDKFKMKAGKKKIIEVLPSEELVEKNDMYITPAKLVDIRRESKMKK